jgi:hypothetical protein
LGHGIFASFNYFRAHHPTDLGLDHHHGVLLRSGNPAHIFLGAASVVYWGYFTFSDGYARNKVGWFSNPSAATSRLELTYTATSAALADLGRRQWGKALGEYHNVPQLTRLPFGSKMIAFLDPENAGIYDNRINRFLTENKALGKSILGDFPGVVASARGGSGAMTSAGVGAPINQQRYQLWCRRLQQLRDALNLAGVQWQCSEPSPQQWRAVDVERAIFTLTKIQPATKTGADTGPANQPDAAGNPSDRGDERSFGKHTPIDIEEAVDLLEDYFQGQSQIEP